MLENVKKYFSMIRFAHTVFAMPFALIGFSLGIKAAGGFNWLLLLEVVLCMVFARNTAMGFNRWLDRDIDALNPRTKNREIPAGKITPGNAMIFIVVNIILFIATTFFINRLVFYLSPVAIAVVMFYSYTKRFTPLCHFVLGCGLALAPIGAYLAVTGEFAVLPLVYSFMVLTWVSGFDIIYSLQDAEFDSDKHLHSVPQWLGIKGALRLSAAVHVATAVLVFVAGYLQHAGVMFAIGAGIFVVLLARQHSIVKADDLRRVNVAFGTFNGVASCVFAAFDVVDILCF
jgi:4-hydroxybenzoate polyprenyltransferase